MGILERIWRSSFVLVPHVTQRLTTSEHRQDFKVFRATAGAIQGDGGDLLLEGETGSVQERSGIRAYVGTVPELFAGDASALHTFLERVP
jgi:hypothetical protein